MLATVFVFCLFHVCLGSTHPLIQIPSLGIIQGRYDQSYNGRRIYSFEGVPYAHPPVGKYRFKEPQSVRPWNGTWDAGTIFRCMQYNQYTPPGQDFVVGDEDCLYLNIYTPSVDSNAKLDVIVYIHGGSFMFNYGGLYRPQYLLDKNVVFITLNYRLGPLGFLSTEDNTVPGNNGLKDQIQALRFINNHVSHFGGNPNSITIMGNSAGGASVHFHYLSHKSNNLFNRGISLSGTTLVPWALMEQPLEKAKHLAASVGCGTKNLEKMINCMRKRPGRQIVASVKKFQPWLYIPFSPFSIVVDSWSEDPVLPQHPFKLLKNGDVKDYPWIVTYTNSEGLYPAEEFYEKLEDVATRWNELIPLILDYNYTVDSRLRDTVSNKIREFYLSNDTLSKATFRRFIPILSERLFVNDIHKAARLQAAFTSSLYSYKFAYRGKNSWFMFGDGEDFGVAHADDVPYVLKVKAVETRSTQKDIEMSEFLVNMVTTFAKTGKPGIRGWQPMSSSGELNYLKIDAPDKMTMESGGPGNEEFWASLPIKENEKLFSETKDEL